MKAETKILIEQLKIDKLGYDMMGYYYNRLQDLSFHHLIYSHHESKMYHLPNEGYILDNGAILNQKTSHDYLHTIQRTDEDRFNYITNELVDENEQRQILYANLCRIHSCLCGFEKEYCGVRTKKGYPLIREEYVRRRIKL